MPRGRSSVMKISFLAIVLFVAIGTCFAQNKAVDVNSIELQNAFDTSGAKPTFRQALHHRACLNLITLKHGCGATSAIHFGTQIGVNVNIFQVNSGRDQRTRMVRIGKHEWTDKFTVPIIEPWQALRPGERRTLSVNASGGDGAPGERGLAGSPGGNADGSYSPAPPAPPIATSTQGSDRSIRKSYASADITEQVSSTIKGKDGKVRKDSYTPYLDAKRGHIYAVHVLEGEKDYYVLVRVDEIVDGKSIKLSYMKVDVPPIQ